MSVDPVLTDNNTGASFNRYVYANNSPYNYVDPDGRFANFVVGGLIGGAIETGVQLARDGAITNRTAIGVAVLSGALTGGVSAIVGKAAVAGTVSVTKAVVAAGSVGGASAATGKVAESALTGKPVSTEEVATAAVLGGAGSAIGARIGLSEVSAVNAMAGKSGVMGSIGQASQGAMRQGGPPAAPNTTIGQQVGQQVSDITSNNAEKDINK
jgi:hypothetical protein